MAQNNLAMCYKEGFGVEKDLAKALEWAVKAVDNGDEEARNTVLEIQQEMSEGQFSCAENDLTLA
jgi:TPR repeat protein